MVVEAITDCLKGAKREAIDALYFGTTISVYKEHFGATTIAMASNLREDVYSAEFGNSLRAGTAALKAGIDAVKVGLGKNVLIVAADCRLGALGSPQEQNFGDGTAVLLIGDKDVIATIEGESVYNEIIDIWQTDSDRFVNTWEDRFVMEQGYLPSMQKAITCLMKKLNYRSSYFAKAVFYNGRCLGMSKNLSSNRIITNCLWRELLPTGKMAGPHAAYSAVAAKREYNNSIKSQESPERLCANKRNRNGNRRIAIKY